MITSMDKLKSLVEPDHPCAGAVHEARGFVDYQWRQVNGDPVEYAIRNGPNGDEFVKDSNGKCLSRAIYQKQNFGPDLD